MGVGTVKRRDIPALDGFRLVAAVLVVAIHTGPLASVSPGADFWLTRVLARLAVPFFFMVTGHFLAQKDWQGTGRLWRRTALVYLVAVLLYLPLNLYNGGFSPVEWLQKLLMDGTFYHLWYFPAVLVGLPLAWGLSRLGKGPGLAVAALLYLVGLGGDSYYGLVSALPGLDVFYDGLFTLFAYTRNGLFLAPLFFLLGAWAPSWGGKFSLAGLVLSLAAMSVEGLGLHAMGVQRHDSMYIFLPLCMVFLFSLLQGKNRGRWTWGRDGALLVYLLHPWCIVLVRGAAKVVGLEKFFIQNSLGHFFAVLLSTGILAALCLALKPQKADPTARAWREVDGSALCHNAQTIQARLGPECRLMAVVKVDGYGHGAVWVARTLGRQGVRHFAVACLAEGIVLRRAGVRGTILILGYTPAAEAPLLARWRLTQTVVDLGHAKALSAQGRRLRVHLGVDTGMHRLGLDWEDAAALLEVFALPRLRVEGMFSHLCLADDLSPHGRKVTQGQTQRFFQAVEGVRAAGRDTGLVHLHASYGVLNGSVSGCDLARIGISLYGVQSESGPVERPMDLWPVLSLRARLALVRTLEPGEGAGYGLAFHSQRPTRLGVVAIGYADGLPRDWGKRGGHVLLRGQRVPVVGRLCMDQLFVDVTAVPAAQAGDGVTLIGRDGTEEISWEEVADQWETISNEVLTKLSHRLPIVEK